jgi:two-component system, NtrC family, response regulator AtoC
MDNRILVVDDDRDYLDLIRKGLLAAGFQHVRVEDDPRQAALRFENGEDFDVAVIDMTMPELNGIELLQIIKNTSPNTECIMVTAVNEARTAVDCLKAGAYDYLVKPVAPGDLVLSIRRGLERKRLLDILEIQKETALPDLIHADPFKPIITQCPKMARVLKEAELHAASDVPVLITGESGTGKELLARAIHDASPRSSHPFMPVNMASIAGNLFDDEFFGHVRGAFTGAEKDRPGYLEQCDQGTLFLDEIGTLPLELQGKLLRFLQDGEFMKLGSSTPRRADIRLIAATNEDLNALMTRKLFRKDLYYRLRGSWLELPPLRERKEDIPLLLNCFLEEFCAAGRKCPIQEEALQMLIDYDYPGNIRELRSVVHSAVNLAQGKAISSRSLPPQLRVRKRAPKVAPAPDADQVLPLVEMEKAYVLKVYRMTGSNKCQTARLLGVGLSTVRRKLESYGIP